LSPSRPSLLVSCGEPSGDLYAAELVRHLRADLPELSVFGLGGDRLAAQGATLLAHVRELAVVGLAEVVRHLGRLRGIYRKVVAAVTQEPPDLAVLVDYAGFNLRLAKALRRVGVPIVYYVSPQLWAWRRGRIRTIRAAVSRMLVIFPFEEAFYREAGVPCTFVGHPLVDLVTPPKAPEELLRKEGLDPERPVIAVLPGSRAQEVRFNLDPLVGAIRLLARRRPELQFLLAATPTLDRELLEGPVSGLPVRVVAGKTHAVLGSARLALVASGTATVETALLGTPMVVVYRLSPLSYALGRPFVRVPHYAMVNLIAGREVVPELIQRDFTPERVAQEALTLLEDEDRAAEMRRDLGEVRRRLGAPGASRRAAQALRPWLTAG
jgi:lipid-A-disaccharide synthase